MDVRVEYPADVLSLAQRWQSFAAGVPCSFFQSWAWIGCFATERFDRPVLISVYRAGAPVAMALFNRRRHRLWLVESGRPGWDTLFIEHNGVLLAPGEAQWQTEALRACLAAALRLGSVVMSGIGAAEWANLAGLQAIVVAQQTRSAPFVTLLDQPLAHVSANTRYQLARSARRYGALGRLHVTRAGSAAEAHRFLDELASLHQRYWTGRGKPGAFADPRFLGFHHRLIDQTQDAAEGAVDLLRVTAGDKVVGYLLNFRFRRRVYAYQSGFNYADAPAHAKPGMTCHQQAIAYYAAEGMGVYDFLAGDDRYKTSLANGQAEMHWVTLAPSGSFSAMVARLRRRLGRKLAIVLCCFLALPVACGAGVPQPAEPGQLVGLVLENTAKTPMPPRIMSFGQVFQPGQVPAGRELLASAGPLALPVQLDVTASYPDGSARLGVVTLRSQALAARQKLPIMLSLAGENGPDAGTAVPLDLSGLLAAFDLAIDLTFPAAAETTAYHLDAHARLAETLRREAVRAQPGVSWRRGPLASEIRVDIPVRAALHVVLDVTGFADGSVFTDVQFRNDVAMGSMGGAQVYDVRISLGGKPVFQHSGVRQFQYQSWHVPVWSGGAPSVNVQHDIAAMEQTGLIPAYDLGAGVSAKVLEEEARSMAAPGWGAPLAANGVTPYMPTTGGRPDIGPTTRANAAWLVTQSAEAASYALGQADAAGAIPWQFWNASARTWLNTAAYPDIWVDGRGGAGSYTTGLTQQVDPNTGWATDTAHQPDLTYVAYLLTGQRRYLDLLNAQAAYSITAAWPAEEARNGAEGNVIRGAQLRAAAWSLREIDEAAWCNPAGSPEQLYFTRIAANNWHWLAGQLAEWSRQEGATAGYVLGSAYGASGMFPPWQQDYFVSTAAGAAAQGNPDALNYLLWAENFIAGRFLSAGSGFRPHNGVAYLLSNNCDGSVCRTWADMQAATSRAGGDNGLGWAHSDGDYGELALAALAGMFNVTHSPRAKEAYQYLLGAGAPYTALSDRKFDVQFNVVPKS